MNGPTQRKSQKTPISVSVAALASDLDAATSTPPVVQIEFAANRPVVMIWDPTASIPQLIKIETVCTILSVEKSTVYELVASGELRPPLKFGTSRRAASRFMLADVVDFIQTLAAKRPLPAFTGSTQ